MREIIGGGATTILVSHSISQVREMCNKILWLHKGRQVVFTDDVRSACDSYARFLREGGEPVFEVSPPAEASASRGEPEPLVLSVAQRGSIRSILADVDAALAKLESGGRQ